MKNVCTTWFHCALRGVSQCWWSGKGAWWVQPPHTEQATPFSINIQNRLPSPHRALPPQVKGLWSGSIRPVQKRPFTDWYTHTFKGWGKTNKQKKKVCQIQQQILSCLCINKSILFKNSFSSWKYFALNWLNWCGINPKPIAHPANKPSHRTHNIMRRENTNKPQMFHCNETSCK